MAIQPTAGNLIGTIAGGGMIGFKKEGSENNSFNAGVGFFLANDFKELTAGLVEGEKAPNKIMKGDTLIKRETGKKENT